MTVKDQFWAIVEVMGHRKFAGLVSEQTISGHGFVRVDIPSSDDEQAFTKMFSPGAIYAITPVTEETARTMSSAFREEPVSEWDVRPIIRQIETKGVENDDEPSCF